MIGDLAAKSSCFWWLVVGLAAACPSTTAVPGQALQRRTKTAVAATSNGVSRSPTASGERLLHLARRAVSRTKLVSDVRSLSIEDRRTWRDSPEYTLARHTLLLPSRYQTHTSGPTDTGYFFTHTVDGDFFWQSPATSRAIRERAETNVRKEFRRVSIAVLLAVLDPLTLVGGERVADGHGWAETLHFAVRGEREVTLMLDPATHRPKAIRYPDQCELVELTLENHREVNGILVPFAHRFTCGEHVASVVNTAVKVDDPGITLAFFRAP